jgi:hypothetical protein
VIRLPAVLVREYRDGDAAGIVRISRENARFYVELAPDVFKLPDEEAYAESPRSIPFWEQRMG